MSTKARMNEAVDKAGAAVESAVEHIDRAGRHGLQGLIDRVEEAEELAAYAREYVQDHPLRAIGIAGAIGVVAGVLITRR